MPPYDYGKSYESRGHAKIFYKFENDIPILGPISSDKE
jgi:hypothetical protein